METIGCPTFALHRGAFAEVQNDRRVLAEQVLLADAGAEGLWRARGRSCGSKPGYYGLRTVIPRATPKHPLVYCDTGYGCEKYGSKVSRLPSRQMLLGLVFFPSPDGSELGDLAM